MANLSTTVAEIVAEDRARSKPERPIAAAVRATAVA
jgi:hypothetical protein